MIAIEEGQTILFYSSSKIFVIPYFENVRLFPSGGRLCDQLKLDLFTFSDFSCGCCWLWIMSSVAPWLIAFSFASGRSWFSLSFSVSGWEMSTLSPLSSSSSFEKALCAAAKSHIRCPIRLTPSRCNCSSVICANTGRSTSSSVINSMYSSSCRVWRRWPTRGDPGGARGRGAKELLISTKRQMALVNIILIWNW